MQQTLHGGAEADGMNPAPDRPTAVSIARARAAQQRERAAFTESTGVKVNDDGQTDRHAWRLPR